MQSVIQKSTGVTPTERLLTELAERTFANLWTYPNPFKEDGKELCDLLVVFEDRAFIFFDRESRKFDGGTKSIDVTWNRWRKEAIDKQVKTALGASRYLRDKRAIFLDDKCNSPFPISLSSIEHIHRIVVAHGAKEACLAASETNVSGSLALSYSNADKPSELPFLVGMARDEPVHVLDSQNLEIIFRELDTIFDFSAYLAEKERAIARYDNIMYCGEEDLLAHYYCNFDEDLNRYTIGTKDTSFNAVVIGEGEWADFTKSGPYNRRRAANKCSYLWDEIINRTGQNALDGKLLGDDNVWDGKSAIHEMAKEPRFHRRALAASMISAIENFPDSLGPLSRHLSLMPSFFEDKAYVFLQIRHDERGDYEAEYRPRKRALLEISCGAARNKFTKLKTIVGIAIDAPKFTDTNAEDFILLDCSEWSDKQVRLYDELNKELNFFGTKKLRERRMKNPEFPPAPTANRKVRKVGRNKPCPCGSNLKFKKCCGR